MTNEEIRNYRYQWCKNYAASQTNQALYHIWMALDADPARTFQGIPMADWEDIVWQECVRRGIFKNDPAWMHPIQFVQATIKTVKKEHRKREHKKVLKIIEKHRTA